MTESGARKSHRRGGKSYYLEFTQVGRYVKVVAIDPESRLETSIVGDASASQRRLTKVAIDKLEYVLKKKRTDPDAARDEGLLI